MSEINRMFPILNDPIIRAIPWSALEPHEAQAKSNHGGQTLRGLASRGGLGISEAYYILTDKPHPIAGSYTEFNRAAFRAAITRLLLEIERAAISKASPTQTEEG